MKRWIRTIPGKLSVFLVTILALCVLTLCVLGAAVAVSGDFYTHTREAVFQDYQQSTLHTEVYDTVRALARPLAQRGETVVNIPDRGMGLHYIIYDEGGTVVAESEASAQTKSLEYTHSFSFSLANQDGALVIEWYGENYSFTTQELTDLIERKEVPYTISVAVDGSLDGLHGNAAPVLWLLGLTYDLRYGVYAIGAIAAVLAIACYVALLCVSGRRPDTEELVPGPLHHVPIDFLMAFGLGVCLCCVYVTMDNYVDTVFLITLLAAELITAAAICLGLSMSVACRIKSRTLLKNTVIWWACKLTWRLCKLCWKWTKALGRWCKRLWGRFLQGTRKLPMIWRTCLIVAALCFLELLFLAGSMYHMESYLAFWLLEHLILVPVILFGALTLRRLQAGGEAMAAGDLNYQVDTHRMYWDFKKHGENLNSIAQGMTRAVEQRLKSERMKTELITNVSHDIKTPLTSIINYADLIGKEPCDNPKVGEYAEVLGRQSDRLKRLIEDLVEASKASTGNLEVLLAPCEAENFLLQISGEYAQKLSDAGLALVTNTPEQSLRVMADGRRMLRVFDNLMNNICKYAQRGTRVYLTLEEKAGMAQITFRNTSSAPLNLTPEELMERFVRGDSSRSSEGNGLGLSIARSLTELQKGSFHLDVDGDLFKVTLPIPLLSDE